MNPIEILEDIGIRLEHVDREDLGPTRDVPSVRAYRDVSGVVYLSKDVGHEYASAGVPGVSEQMRRDDERRARRLKGAIVRPYIDFGCGAGGLVRLLGGVGVDPCWSRVDPMTWTNCMPDMTHQKHGVQTVTCNHVIEHLSDPVDQLRELRDYMADGATLIVEVPHGRDWLLTNCEAFRRFSLWSQHLILHTRESLAALLRASGFAVDRIEGFQRYPLSNHLHWLTAGKPGCFDVDEDLDRAYAARLARTDETDTLICWARKVATHD